MSGDISILKVKVNGDVKGHSLVGEDEDILKINFGFKLTKKKSVQIEIVFNLIIPNSTHRFGWFDENVNLGNWYPIVCYYENGEFDISPYFSTILAVSPIILGSLPNICILIGLFSPSVFNNCFICNSFKFIVKTS